MERPEKTGIEALPEATRKKLFWVFLVVLSVCVFGTWVVLFSQWLRNPGAEDPATQDTSTITDDLTFFYNQAQTQLDTLNLLIKSRTDQSPKLSPEETAALKRKLIEIQTADWQTYANPGARIKTLKLPSELRIYVQSTSTISIESGTNGSGTIIITHTPISSSTDTLWQHINESFASSTVQTQTLEVDGLAGQVTIGTPASEQSLYAAALFATEQYAWSVTLENGDQLLRLFNLIINSLTFQNE